MSAVNLKVNTEALPNSRIAVKIEVTGDRCQAKYDEAVTRLSRSVSIPGFRKGKVPKAVILQQIGINRIKASALETLMDTAWKEAIQQESIEPLSEPELKDSFEALLQNFEPGNKFSFTLQTDIPPKPILKETQGLKASANFIEFDPKQVDDLIEQSRKQLATLVPIENREAQMGDVAVISFQGTYLDNGSEIEGGSAESMDIDLEEGKMIPGFIEGIIGMNINDEKVLKCEFPKDYQEEDARGRKASFKVTLNDLKTRELPELDDAFAKQASDKSNMKEMREDLTSRVKQDVERKNINNKHQALIDALVNELEIELPASLIDLEVRNLVEQTARNFAQQGMDVKSIFTKELVDSLMQSSRPEAERNLKQKFALNALAEQESIKIEEHIIDEKVKEVSKEFANEPNIDQKRLREAVKEDLLKEKLLTWLEDKNEVIEEKTQSSNKAVKSKKTTSTTSKKSEKNKTKAIESSQNKANS